MCVNISHHHLKKKNQRWVTKLDWIVVLGRVDCRSHLHPCWRTRIRARHALKNFFTLHLLCGVRILWDCSEVTIEWPRMSNDGTPFTHHAPLVYPPHTQHMPSQRANAENLRLLKTHTALTSHCSEYTLSTGSQELDGHYRYSPLTAFYTSLTLWILLENPHFQPKL